MGTGQQQNLLNIDGQQPMSLMTVRNINFKTSTPSKHRTNSGTSAHDDADDELLTLRILEASERKMMMIKELLSPEEYQSLASDLFTSPIEFGRRRKEFSRLQTEFGTFNSSGVSGRQQWPDMEAGPQSEPAFGLADDESQLQQSEPQPRLSRSESNLNQQQEQQPTRQVRVSGDIKQNLDRRRKAIEFFFEGAPKEVAANLVTESRFSQYLEPRSESEERLLDSGGRTVSGLAYLFAMMLSLLHWLVELLPSSDQPAPSKEESAIEPNGMATSKEIKEMETKFMGRHKMLNYAPYTRKSNMLAMIERLKADNQFEKLVQLAYPKANKKVTGKQAKQQQQIISITRPEGDFKLRLIGLKLSRWVATRSAPASPMTIDHAGTSRILVHDPRVECLARASERVSELLLNELQSGTKRESASTSIVWPTVELRAERISIVQHKLLHQEVRLARKLTDLYQQHELLVSLLERISFLSDKLLSDFTKQLEKKTEAASNLGSSTSSEVMVQSFERLIRLLELKCNLLTRISMKQLRLSIVWSELEAARASQGFNLTALKLYLTVQDDKEAIDGEQSQATIYRLVQNVDRLLGIDERELFSKQLKRMHKLLEFEQTRLRETSRLQRVKLDPVGLEKTPKEEEVPQDELDWRQKLNEWLKSVRFTIKPLDSSGRLRLCNLNTDSLDDLYRLDLTKSGGGQSKQPNLRLVQTGSSLPSELRLRVEASQESSRFVNISGERILKQVTIAVPIGSDLGLLNEQGPVRRRYEVQLDWQASEDRDDEDEPLVRVSLEFSVLCSLGNPKSSSKVDHLHEPVKFAKTEQARRILIDRLYASLFVAERNPFENTHTKLAKLLNRISRRTLISIMNEMGLNVPASPRPYCVLNHRLFSFESSSVSETMALHLANFKPVNLRCILLALRWADQMINKRPSRQLDPQQPMASAMVYLCERENLQRLQALKFDSSSSQQLQEFRSKLAGNRTGSTSQSERLAGYKSIEQTRLLAVDYIRRLEQLIDQILEAYYSLKDSTQDPMQTGAATSDGHRPRMTARDLLIEPTVTLTRPTVSLDVAQLMRSLVPRPTARRPLMPKRRRLQDPAGSSSKLSQLVEQAKFAANKGPTGGELEMNAIGQWWRSGGNKRSSGESLRLIVTIQQATNVPYRSILAQNPLLNRQQQQQQQQSFFLGSPLPVSSSPFFSPSPLFGGAASPLGVPNASLQQRLLVPATTYVEAIFQRKQLASSLAQGRNPAWNETLFFSVDLDPSVAGGNSTFSSSSNQRQVQLVDECLQLNLYDCRSFLQDPAGGGAASETADLEGQWATLGASGGQLDPMLLASSGGSANRLLVAQRRIERHLIGSLRIPMSALLTTSGRVEGSFALSQPLLLDNYHYDAEPMQFQSISRNHHQHELGLDQLTAGLDTGQDSGTGSRTHLSLFITLDPPVSLPMSVQLPTGSHERVDLFEFAKLWEQIMLRFVPPSGGMGSNKSRQTRLDRNHHTSWPHSRNGGGTSQRHIRALVLRDDARYFLVCRYLRPMQPPETLMQPQVVNENQDEPEEEVGDQRDEQMRRLARFVSQLSPLKYGLFNMRLLASSLWFDSGQLLAGQLGGHEEKAVLLCNYFLQLGKCSALLLGESLQSGRCVYVLVWSEQLKTGGGLGQLELQMDELMEELTTAGRQNSTRGATSQARPVNQSNFIARLPILINPRSCHLWDPSLGVRYELSAHNADSSASRPPLISVGSIVTVENVYANLQPNGGVSKLSFDIRQKNLWFPLFSADHRPPPASLNNSDNNLLGAHPSASQVESNRVAIERESRRILQLSWRRKLAHLELLAKLVGRPALTLSGSFGSSPSLAFNEPSRSSYDSFGPAQCQELKEAIERSIKSHLLTWRPTRPTYFNRTLSRIIAEKLASFERRLLQPDNRCQSQTDTGMDERQEDLNRRRMATNPDWWRAELADLIRSETANLGLGGLGGGLGATSSQVISWPINMAYTSMQAIIDGLYASGVHNSDLVLESSPPAFGGEAKTGSGEPASQQPSNQLSTQFLVATHVEPYPARVMSVWLYVGALVTANQAQANRQFV